MVKWLACAFLGLTALSGTSVINGEAIPAVPTALPTSSIAVAALKDLDKAVQASDEVWKQAKVVSERKFIEKMKQALAIATKAGNLDEANLINAQIKSATVRIEAAAPPVSIAGGILRRAMWVPMGEEIKSKDVTDALRPFAISGTIKLKDVHLGDPANGFRKVLVIDGVYGNHPFTLRIPEGGINGFCFGPFDEKTK